MYKSISSFRYLIEYWKAIDSNRFFNFCDSYVVAGEHYTTTLET